MKLRKLDLLFLLVVVVGGAHLATRGIAQTATPPKQPICCSSSSGAKCCGATACETSQGVCSAW